MEYFFLWTRDERAIQECLAKTTDQYSSWTWKQASVTQRSLSNTRLSHHSCLLPIYYHQMLQYFPRPPKAFISFHQRNCSTQGCSPCFPPSWHHRALHHISHSFWGTALPQPQTTTSLCSPATHHLCARDLPPIPMLSKSRSTAQHFLSHIPYPRLPADTTFLLTPTAVPWHKLTPAPVHFPPLGTELHHTQQSLPLHTGQTPPISCTSIPIHSSAIPIHSGAGRHAQLGSRKNSNQPR